MAAELHAVGPAEASSSETEAVDVPILPFQNKHIRKDAADVAGLDFGAARRGTPGADCVPVVEKNLIVLVLHSHHPLPRQSAWQGNAPV